MSILRSFLSDLCEVAIHHRSCYERGDDRSEAIGHITETIFQCRQSVVIFQIGSQRDDDCKGQTVSIEFKTSHTRATDTRKRRPRETYKIAPYSRTRAMSFSEKMTAKGASQSMSFQLRFGGFSRPGVGLGYFLCVSTLKKGLFTPRGSMEPDRHYVSIRIGPYQPHKLTISYDATQCFR